MGIISGGTRDWVGMVCGGTRSWVAVISGVTRGWVSIFSDRTRDIAGVRGSVDTHVFCGEGALGGA